MGRRPLPVEYQPHSTDAEPLAEDGDLAHGDFVELTKTQEASRVPPSVRQSTPRRHSRSSLCHRCCAKPLTSWASAVWWTGARTDVQAKRHFSSVCSKECTNLTTSSRSNQTGTDLKSIWQTC